MCDQKVHHSGFLPYIDENLALNIASWFMLGCGVIHTVHLLINIGYDAYQKYCRKSNDSQSTEGPDELSRRTYEGFLGWFFLLFGFAVFVAVQMKGNFTSFSQLCFPTWYNLVTWCGVFLGTVVLVAFAATHFSLGTSWSATVQRKERHKLVTSGAYKLARHPMYAVILWWPVVTFVICLNYIYSLAIAVLIAYPVSRYRFEEVIMVETFGEDYLEYRSQVGAFFPWTWQSFLRGRKSGLHAPLL